MDDEIKVLSDFGAFPALKEIPEPPKQLWYQGQLPNSELRLLCVVGSRRYTSYGERVLNHLLQGLAGYPIGIVSGLALGIDTLAHQAALKANLYTLAVPGSGLDSSVLYPRSNQRLARKILEARGGLMSEYEPTTQAAPWTFPRRNRLMAGLSSATLVIEATEKSGTLITARLTVDYNRELLVVPGDIFSRNSVGPHQFLKLGATPVTSAANILEVLGIDQLIPEQLPRNGASLSAIEKTIIEKLIEPMPRDDLIRACNLPTAEANTILMEMEFKGYLQSDGATVYPTLE